MRNAYSILVGKCEGKRPLGRPKHRRKDSIRTYLRDIMWEDVDWMHLVLDRDNESSVSMKGGKFLTG
jgi:hypothetical protein